MDKFEQDIIERLTRMEGLLRSAIDDRKKLEEKVEKLEKRVRDLEDWRTGIKSNVLLVGIVWVPVCALLVRLVAKGVGW